MVGGEREPGQGGYLPPEAAGAEPDLGGEQEPQQQSQVTGGWQPPRHSQPTPPAHAPAPYAQQGYAPPQQGYPPQPQGGWTPPPPGWHPPPAQPQPWGHAPQGPPAPDNGAAVAGFTLAAVAAALLLLSAGTSSIVSVICAALGIFYSRQGRRRVDSGETPKHRSIAQAGFVTGIVTLVLAVLATVFWVLIVVLYTTSEDFRRDLEDGSGSDGLQTSARIAGLAVRVACALAS